MKKEEIVITSCLIVKPQWANQIVTGRKKTEYRSSLTAKRGRIGIIRSGTSEIIGDVEIVDCAWSDDSAEWYLKNPRKYKTPIPCIRRKGQVIWATVSVTASQISKALR